MTTYSPPHLIDFSRLGESSIGYISVGEFPGLVPFEIKRIFWTYYTPESIVRGRHAHHDTEMILIAVAGKIIVNTEMQDGSTGIFKLDKPDVGLYMPPKCWHTMQYSHNAVQIVITSTVYNEKDYIRSYDEFTKP